MAALNDISKALVGETEEAPPAAAPAQSPVLKFLQESQTRSQAAMSALDARRNQLINLSMSRRNQVLNPQLLALASGLLAPTKTGSFGESLGYAARGLGEEQTKQQALDIQEAKMMYELEAEAMKQREALAAQGLLPAILGGKLAGATPSAAPGAAPSAVSKAPITAQPTQNILNQLSDEELLAMSANPATKQVAQTVLQLREAARKDKVRFRTADGQEREVSTADQQALFDALDKNDFETAKKWYERHGLSWNFIEETRPNGVKILRPMTNAEIKAAEAAATKKEEAKYGKQEPVWVYELGQYIPMNPAKAALYDEAREQGKGKEWLQKNIPEAMPTATTTTAGGGGSRLPPSASQQAGETTTAQKKAESAVEARTAFVNRGMNANTIIQPAEEIIKLASDPTYSMAMGVIDAPGLSNVIAKAISEGVKAGDFSVGFPNIRTAVMQLKRDSKGNPLSDDQRQQILDGFQKYMQNATQIELLYTQLYLSKQGQVTEGERKLVRATGVDKEDSPNVVKAKAQAIVKRGQFDEKAATAFIDWEKKNPGGTLEEFQLKSPEYKALKNELNSEMNRIYDVHFGRRGAQTSTAPNQPSGVDQSVVDRLAPSRGK